MVRKLHLNLLNPPVLNLANGKENAIDLTVRTNLRNTTQRVEQETRQGVDMLFGET